MNKIEQAKQAVDAAQSELKKANKLLDEVQNIKKLKFKDPKSGWYFRSCRKYDEVQNPPMRENGDAG